MTTETKPNENATKKAEAVPVQRAQPAKTELAHAWNPWKMFDELREEMEEFWQGAKRPTLPRFPRLAAKEGAAWLPSTDVYSTSGKLVVKADLPGLKKEDVEVMVEDGYLVVKGERKEEKEEKDKEYFRSERSYGSFYRRVPLPENVKTDAITAKVHDGILEVTVPLPKTAAPEAKKIAVS